MSICKYSTTVQLLAVLGVAVCCACATARPSSATLASLQAMSQAVPDPVLNAGDELRVTVWRQPELSGQFSITADGTLPHPLLQTLPAAGVPLSQFKQQLLGLLRTYEQNPQVVVELLSKVTVAGEVQRPDLYGLPRETTIAQAIAQAGGTTVWGRLDRVRLVRGTDDVLFDLMDQSVPFGTLPVKSGDQIIVGRRTQTGVALEIFRSLVSLAGAAAALIIAFSTN